MALPDADALVIGGGVIGSAVAGMLRKSLGRVVLLEREGGLLRRASYRNQARVHGGYHYPRSFLTGLRSRVNYPRFIADFADCVDRSVSSYYAIARRYSRITSPQFAVYCRRIGAPVAAAPRRVRDLFNHALVEEVFEVDEVVFDARRLAAELSRRLQDLSVAVQVGADVKRIRSGPDGQLIVEYEHGHTNRHLGARHVFNCTYSGVNALLRRSGLPLLAVKHEMTEMALVEVPPSLRSAAITVMCGPFFSLMPFPAAGLHTLSHVRYTPHTWWHDGDDSLPGGGHSGRLASRYGHMSRDAARYVPTVSACRYRESLWETKTVLRSSEVNDSRPILFVMNHGLPNLHCIVGGKIDNIYDVLDELERVQLSGQLA